MGATSNSTVHRTQRVWVTRPIEHARATAQILSERGYHPVVLPLSEYRAITTHLPDIRAYHALIFTSQHALHTLDNLPPEQHAYAAHMPIHCVGEHTAQRARDAGYFAAECAGTTAQHVLATLTSLPKKSRFLYLAGTPRHTDLGAALMAQGHSCDTVDVYTTQYRTTLTPDEQSQLADCHAALLYSTKAAEALVAVAPTLPQQHLLCLSHAIADACAPLGWPCSIATEPTQRALLQTLDE